MEMMQSLLIFIGSLALLWIGSGLAVGSVLEISRRFRITSFFVSFFVLGLFTSLTEIMVGINALIGSEPEIFVGNLIGSSVVVFLCIIPVLAIVGRGVNLNHTFVFRDLVTAAFVVGVPALLTLDNSVSQIDALVCIAVYGYFLYTQEKRTGTFGKLTRVAFSQKKPYAEIVRIAVAMAIVFAASRLLVRETAVLGEFIGISPFVISVVILSLGTNIPEFSIAVRSVLAKKKDIAFGNYVGSASLNTLEMGVLTLLNRDPVPAEGSNYSVLVFLAGLLLFVVFGRSRNTVSRDEGIILFTGYLLFTACELLTGPGWTR